MRFVKKFFWLAMLLCGASSASAFSLGGPVGNGTDDWQTEDLAYGVEEAGDLSAPKQAGDEYRRTQSTLYYTYEESFLLYFGSNGVAAVDSAYAILNGLTNVSMYSSNLAEFPLNSQGINLQAESLLLTDVKSVALGFMMEQLGLFQPVRAVWVLRDREELDIDDVDCPFNVRYLVTKRNLDINPSGVPYSSYVNGTLYTYFIYEDCGDEIFGGTILDPIDADAVEYPADPFAAQHTAVADMDSFWYAGLAFNGGYYTGLTRDDVAGLRYLYRSNNVNLENSGPDTVQFVTNATPALLVTQDLGLLIARARTNDAAALQALYPDLIIESTTTFFELERTPIISIVPTTSPYAPAGSFLFVLTRSFTTNVVTRFQHTFANVVTNRFSTQSVVRVFTIDVGTPPFAPSGAFLTTVTNSQTFRVNQPAGDFYIIPAGLCAVHILSNIFSQVIPVTTPPVAIVNPDGTITTSPGRTTFFTNANLIYFPVTCPADAVARRQGVEKITFARRDFDSLLGSFFQPITNEYTTFEFTNNVLRPNRIRRVVTAPDFLFRAADLADFPAVPFASRNLNFNDANINAAAQAGPGTIEPATVFTYSKVGPLFGTGPIFPITATNFFLLEEHHLGFFFWGSFDGSTNDPIVYPDGTSLENLENLLLMSVTTTVLPAGTTGVAYSTQLAGSGGFQPYTWSLPGAGLPPGLTMEPAGEISGTPTEAGTYDFVVRMTDFGTRFIDVPLTIVINDP